MNCGCKLLSRKRVAGLPPLLHPRLLAGLSNAELSALLVAATHRQFLAFSVVIHEEDPAERFFLLTSGRGRHFVLTTGGRKILLHWLTAGQVFGGAAALATPSHYLASTEVLEDSCALVWDRKTIRELGSRYPRLLDNGLSIAITERLAWLISAFVSVNSDDAIGRIAHMLISLACGIGRVGPEGIEVQVANEDLAAGANVTKFTVSRALKAWEQEGVVRKGRGRIVIRRPELLVAR